MHCFIFRFEVVVCYCAYDLFYAFYVSILIRVWLHIVYFFYNITFLRLDSFVQLAEENRESMKECHNFGMERISHYPPPR